ncbi:MAG: type VI secretion system baseplate subunit TssE [Rhizobacter sp.]
MGNQYKSSLLDRLVDLQPGVDDPQAGRPVALSEVKDSVARDLESLLNTRSNPSLLELESPLLRSSLLSYGIPDFSDRSLDNPVHRGEICRSIERAVSDHEPRLKQVEVELSTEARSDNRLHFIIRAILVVDFAREAVNFDAHLQPLTLEYSITRGGKPAGKKPLR